MAQEREEFVNRTQGWIGVMKINRKGDEVADTVPPGERVFLTAEEQELTAQVHRSAADSPFTVRTIAHYDPATHEEIDRFEAPLLEKVTAQPPPPPPTHQLAGAAGPETARRRQPETQVAA